MCEKHRLFRFGFFGQTREHIQEFLTIEVVLHKLIGCVNVELQMNVVALCDKTVSLLCKNSEELNKNNSDEEVNQIRFPFSV